ncbi:hypothetical protein SMD20_46680 [Nonomuraea sp. LP-02]|uniref:hypothetical protein n=1 Tax=Nonomuraea sp. LP-02 TaxID=3097960 RepID=UPI002E35ED98|nr:hypothetical protein [Nonomuraea sp. LP-02]MED7931776.1 hypothetical protein [Nonomuraea sp. LP-02]
MAKPEARPTTGVSRRHGPLVEGLGFSSRYVSANKIKPEPATPTVLPRPFGDLATASISHLAQLATDTWEGAYVTRRQRGTAVGEVLSYLTKFPGKTWQERWDNSPLSTGEVRAADLGNSRSTGVSAPTGLRSLLCLRVIQPSLLAFRSNTFNNYPPFFITAQADPLLDKFAAQAATYDVEGHHRYDALRDVCGLLTVQGIALADLTPAAMLHHGHENRQVMAQRLPGTKITNRFAGPSAWNILHAMGALPARHPVHDA